MIKIASNVLTIEIKDQKSSTISDLNILFIFCYLFWAFYSLAKMRPKSTIKFPSYQPLLAHAQPSHHVAVNSNSQTLTPNRPALLFKAKKTRPRTRPDRRYAARFLLVAMTRHSWCPRFESMSFVVNILACKLKIVNNRNWKKT